MRLPGLLECKPAGVERGRPQLRTELVGRRERIFGEHMFYHPDLAVFLAEAMRRYAESDL